MDEEKLTQVLLIINWKIKVNCGIIFVKLSVLNFILSMIVKLIKIYHNSKKMNSKIKTMIN